MLTIDEVGKEANASLNGVGVRGLLSNDRLILGVLNELVISIRGVFRGSRPSTGVDVSVGRDEQGVEVQMEVTPLAVIGLLKNCEGENGRDFIGVFWGVGSEVVLREEDVEFREILEVLQSSR